MRMIRPNSHPTLTRTNPFQLIRHQEGVHDILVLSRTVFSMGNFWWILYRIERAAEREHILRNQHKDDDLHESLLPTRSCSRTSKGSTRPGRGKQANNHSKTEELVEFELLVSPIARHFERLDRKERLGRKRAGTTIVIGSFLGLIVATSFNNLFAGVGFFALALYGTCSILGENSFRS
jgi:hypothetical protein